MSTTENPLPRTWDPLTPRGVAAFARAPLLRLLAAQAIMSIVIAVAVVWFLDQVCFPVVRGAIRQLPSKGEIRGEQLDWPGDSPIRLAGNHCLGLGVDLTHSGRLSREAQIQLEFGTRNVRVVTPIDYAVVAYPAGWRIAFNRPEIEPLWGAWELPILAGAGAGVALGSFILWAAVATVYWVPVWLMTFFSNRDLSWTQSWRLAGTALISGELFLTIAFVGHGLGWINLVQLVCAVGLGLLAGWIYLFICPLFLPRHPEADRQKRNPFAKEPAGKGNPFATPPSNKGGA